MSCLKLDFTGFQVHRNWQRLRVSEGAVSGEVSACTENGQDSSKCGRICCKCTLGLGGIHGRSPDQRTWLSALPSRQQLNFFLWPIKTIFYVQTFYPLQRYLKYRQTSMLGTGVIPAPDGTGQSPALPFTIDATLGHLEFTCLSFLADFKTVSASEV